MARLSNPYLHLVLLGVSSTEATMPNRVINLLLAIVVLGGRKDNQE